MTSRPDPLETRALSQNPEAVRSRVRRAANPEKSNNYHLDYQRRRKAEDADYLERRRAAGRRSARNRRERVRMFLLAAKDSPCDSCGMRLPPEIMDFDHIFGPKFFNIAQCTRQAYRSIVDIAAEIRKCRVVCPNCHRLRHHEERLAALEGQHYWTDYKVAEEWPHAVSVEGLA